MYKASVELGKINEYIKLKASIILTSENSKMQIVNKFSYMGNDYIKFSPNPFVTITINSILNKGEQYSSNNSINLNNMGIFSAIRAMKKCLNSFTIKEMYSYDAFGKLQVNQKLAKQKIETFECNGKIGVFVHTVVPPSGEYKYDYEGVIFYINKIENFCYLRYDELMYLLYRLEHIDLISISFHLIQFYNMLKNEESNQIQDIVIEPASDDDYVEYRKSANIEKPNELPNI